MKWSDIGNTIGKVAPMLGTLLAPATGGASLAIGALVSSALGVENTPEAVHAELKKNPDALLKLKELEFKEEASIRQHIFDLAKIEQEKYLKAHDTYQNSNHEMADKIAMQIVKNNLPIIALLVMSNIGVVWAFEDNATLIAIASNVIGVAIGHLFNERQAIVNFFFGSSMGSKNKTKLLDKDK